MVGLMLVVGLAIGQGVDVLDGKYKDLLAQLKTAKTAEGLTFLAGEFLSLAGEAEAADVFDVAVKSVEQAGKVSKGLKNTDLAQQAQTRLAEIKDRAAEYAKAKVALKTLESKPDDAAAHSAVGKYQCFVKGDWKKGLPHLAKGADADLRGLARMEELAFSIASDPEVDQKLTIGDAWWPKNRERSLYWYKWAWPKLNPLQKEKVRARFKETYARGKPAEKDVLPTGWAADLAIRATMDELYAVSGKRSLRIPPGKDGAAVAQPATPHGGAKECVLTLRVLTEGGPAEIRPVWVQFSSQDVAVPGGQVGVPGDEPWWHEIRVVIKVPEKTTHGRVGFTPPVSGRVWVDAVSLKTDGGVELVVNGDFEK